ncbi:MAG: nuclear transport factor 2 family protein [Cyclobacteriaceae bacterium]
MTKIVVTPDCNNAPKKQLLKDFNIAFATGDVTTLEGMVSEGILWTIHGDKKVVGKASFVEEINIMKQYVADELIIHTIITHGAEAAVNGIIKMGGDTYAFCDIYHFKSAGSSIIKALDSYVVKS